VPSDMWDSKIRNLYAPSVSSAFDSFLDRELSIGQGIRSKASDSQNHLRDFLASERNRDWSFPRVLSLQDSDFLGGSFARHTKIWPLDDIDVYIPLDGHGLFYHEHGLRLPYTVVSDGVLTFNPLLGSRWMINNLVSSHKLILEFAGVLQRHYGESTSVQSNGQAVSVRMTHGQTKDEDGLGYDVVPCFSMKPDDSTGFHWYCIPDGNNGWIRTNPRVDTYISDELQRFNSGHYRKAIKLLKYWNKENLNSAFSSYYIELAMAIEFLGRKSRNQSLTSVSEGVSVGFARLQQAYQSGNLSGWIKGASQVQAPLLSARQQGVLMFARAKAKSAYDSEVLGHPAQALEQWKSIFGERF
jgi:hypothetical protein